MTVRDLLLAIDTMPRWIGAVNPFAAPLFSEDDESESVHESNPKFQARIAQLESLQKA